MAQNINLYQKPPKPPGGVFSRTGIVALVVLAAGSVALLQQLGAREIADRRAELTRLQDEAKRLERMLADVPSPNESAIEQLAADEREVAGLEAVASRLSAGALGRSGGFIDHLRAFGRATAEGVWLTAIRLDNAGGGLVIEGKAVQPDRLPVYFAALRTEPLFAGTGLASIEVKASDEKPAQSDTGRSTLVEFRIRSIDTRAAPKPAVAAAPEAAKAPRDDQRMTALLRGETTPENDPAKGTGASR
jgi:Tfp pilus assembly protein PilN